jgi:hypothetical protein
MAVRGEIEERKRVLERRPQRAEMAPVPSGSALSASRSIGSVWETIGSPVPWEQVHAWPPDVFALTDLLLIQSGAYRFVASPPAGAAWPPHDRWAGEVRSAASGWSEAVRLGTAPGPGVVLDQWETLTKAREVPLDDLTRGDPWNVCEAIITLHALADEACSSLNAFDGGDGAGFAQRAWAMLEREGSLSRFPPSQIRVLPKTHVPPGGITVRSLARYLSTHTSPVDVKWRRGLPPAASPGARADTSYRVQLLLLPWPPTVDPSDFRPSRSSLNVQDDEFGFFEFEPHAPLDLGYVRGALEAAQREGGVASVILPESAVAESEIAPLERTVSDFGVVALVAGVRGRADPATGLGRNYAHIGIWTGGRWIRYEQDKHHRWLLDAGQIRQYHLERSLDPRRKWWEAIAVPPHGIEIFDFGRGASTAALICEDLARVDDVAEVIRGIGPTTVFALLLDGPQIASRWSSRYASVLADDPGSTVIAMTSLGMALRSRPKGTTPSRSIALWKDAERGLREIELSPDADAALLIASEDWETAWTADGRRHAGATPRLVLEEIRQLHVGGEQAPTNRR